VQKELPQHYYDRRGEKFNCINVQFSHNIVQFFMHFCEVKHQFLKSSLEGLFTQHAICIFQMVL
jgi:hypothetical protein